MLLFTGFVLWVVLRELNVENSTRYILEGLDYAMDKLKVTWYNAIQKFH